MTRKERPVRCDDARLALSLRLDGEMPDDVDPGELDRHLGGCPGCAAFERSAGRVRAGLRFEPVHDAPDVVPAVAACAALAGMAAGAAFVGIGREPRSPAAADVPERVVAAQSSITSLDAQFRLVERGVGTGDAGAGAGERSRDGRLVYAAPESLALTIDGAAPGDDGADTELIVDGERWWQAT